MCAACTVREHLWAWTSGEGSLPALSDRPLVGRAADVLAVRRLVEEDGARLVTLVGPGGVGKTRLAVALSEALGERFTDGVFSVDLAPLREAELVSRTIAEALDIHDAPP